MVKKIILIAIRHLLKEKTFSLVNFVSLVIGFATFCLISMFIYYEFNWDKHNTNYNQIYQLQLRTTHYGRKDFTSSMPGAIRYQLLDNIAEIEKSVLIHGSSGINENFGEFISSDKNNLIYEKNGFYAEQSIFDIFTYQFLEGSSENALVNPYSIVLSKTLADKVFPDGKAIGKQVYIEKKHVLTVTGVYADQPLNSHFRPAYLTTMVSYSAMTGWYGYENNWEACGFNCYVLLKENASVKSVDSQIENCLVNRKENNFAYLRPLSKLHISPTFQNGLLVVYALFSLVAFLVLLLSCFNFINLQTANSITRAREIGIKKIMGSPPSLIGIQFMIESFIISILAGIMGLLVAYLMVPVFNYIMNFNYDFHFFRNWKLIVFMFVATSLTGIISGFYPAFVLSSLNPVTALQKKFNNTTPHRISFKKILVTTQLTISLFLLIVSLIIFRQADFIMKKDLGFDKNNILFASIKSAQPAPVEEIRQRLLQYPEIVSVSFSQFAPYILPTGDEVNWEGGDPAEKLFIRKNRVSYDYLQTFGIQLIMGRDFSRDYPTDLQDACLINESMMKQIGWENPIGKKIWNNQFTVIGVYRDFHMKSATDLVEPCVLRMINQYDTDGMYAVKYSGSNDKKVKQVLLNEFEKSYPNDAVGFVSFSDYFEHQPEFAAWLSFKRIFLFFTSISILVATLGMFGLVLFISRKKTKEIGIRKILGSTLFDILRLLTSETQFLMGLAVLIAFPSAVYVYQILPGAYKFELGLWEFILAFAIVAGVSILTIVYHVLRAATRNPSEALRYE